MKSHSKIQQLKTLASYQWGLFSSAQAEEINIQRSEITRLAKNNSIERIRRGIYAFDDSGGDPNIDIKAAWMSLYPKQAASERLSNPHYDAIIAGRTAAALHKIGDFYSSPFSFAVKKRKQTRQDDIVCYVWEIDPSDIVIVNSLPVTSPERTIVDLIRLNEDPSLVGSALNDVIKLENGFDYDRFVELLKPLALRNGFKKSDGESFASFLFSQYLSLNVENQIQFMLDNIVRFNSENSTEALLDHIHASFDYAKMINDYDMLKLSFSHFARSISDLIMPIDLGAVSNAAKELVRTMQKSERRADEIQNTP